MAAFHTKGGVSALRFPTQIFPLKLTDSAIYFELLSWHQVCSTSCLKKKNCDSVRNTVWYLRLVYAIETMDGC